MVVDLLIEELGGTNLEDREDKSAISEDQTQTLQNVMRVSSYAACQNAYQTLQSNDVFENKDILATDEFLDSDGTNETVNTGTSTAFYDSANIYYTLNYSSSYPGDGSSNDASVSTINSTLSNQSTEAGIRGTTIQGCFLISYTVNSSVSGATRFRIFDSANSTEYTETFSGTGEHTLATPFYLSPTTEYKFIIDDDGGDYTPARDTTPTFNDSIDFDLDGGYFSGDDDDAYNIDSIITETAVFDSSSVVVCDTATLTLDSSETAIGIYTDATHTANTSASVVVSDGTTPVASATLSDKFVLIPFDISTGTLELTFTLETTDTADTPFFKGYAVQLVRAT